MIVTDRSPRPKRPAAKSAKITIPGPLVVRAKPGRYRADEKAPRDPDPEADARVAAFFARMGITWKPTDQA